MVTSTYRVQVRGDFDLDTTAGLVDYLSALGVTHLYSAPILQSVTGSTHGYDVVDPTRVNSELGGAEALDRLVTALRSAGMGLVVDIVPNHVGVSVPRENPAWWSVLRDGQASPYARWFDIEWSRGPILIPVLADDRAIAEIAVEGDELRYHEHRYPIAAGTDGGSARDIHDRQHYRLVDWRRGDNELTYRRFFAVSGLAGVRVENRAVFDETHAEILRWVRGGIVDGIRIDHPDGLRDPGGYLRRLRALAPGVWLVVEKILEYGETLPSGWPVDGTTGYDALREVCGVFIDTEAVQAFPSTGSYTDAVRTGKREAATQILAAELGRLARLAPAVPNAAKMLAEIAAHLPIYRTYLPDGDTDLVDAIASTHPEPAPQLVAALHDANGELAQRFQQFTGAVMGKGVEDTAFYRWTRFTALNEVGGAPDHFGVDAHEFHESMLARLINTPRGMTTLSTHDTKRGEDVRARLAVLSELPDEWHAAMAQWTTAAPLADQAIAELLWQSAVGTWPIERERLHAYAEKAAREANSSTSWGAPDAGFEAAMHTVIDAMYDDRDINDSVNRFVERITRFGWSNSLGQKLTQITMPGVPDTYQGTELWDNSLVDPDNRRPVDFAARREMLDRLDHGWLPPVDASGAAKMLVTSRALRLRRDRPELFAGYRPVPASGDSARHVLAFDRGGAIAVVTRLPLTLAACGGHGNDLLMFPRGQWLDTLTGNVVAGPDVAIADILTRYPVALLVAA
jgi:(1->4)-alpha-D-glucan 1-alpha-D-glucosylmutase